MLVERQSELKVPRLGKFSIREFLVGPVVLRCFVVCSKTPLIVLFAKYGPLRVKPSSNTGERNKAWKARKHKSWGFQDMLFWIAEPQ